jgi:hypothetical protein
MQQRSIVRVECDSLRARSRRHHFDRRYHGDVFLCFLHIETTTNRLLLCCFVELANAGKRCCWRKSCMLSFIHSFILYEFKAADVPETTKRACQLVSNQCFQVYAVEHNSFLSKVGQRDRSLTSEFRSMFRPLEIQMVDFVYLQEGSEYFRLLVTPLCNNNSDHSIRRNTCDNCLFV